MSRGPTLLTVLGLILPDWEAHLEVVCDACGYAYVFVLLQTQEVCSFPQLQGTPVWKCDTLLEKKRRSWYVQLPGGGGATLKALLVA